MTRIVVGRWGRNLALRIPAEIAAEVGVLEGEKVDIEVSDGAIHVRRAGRQDTADALEAAEAILAEAQDFSFGDLSPRDLIDDGRRR